MTASVIVVASGDYSSTANPTLTVINAAPVGSIVVVSKVANAAQTNFTGVSDSRGNTYTVGTSSSSSPSPVVTLKQFYSVLTTGLAVGDTLSMTSNGASRQAFIVEAIVGLTSSPRDGADLTTVGSSLNPSPGSTGTLSQSDEFLYGVVGTSDGTISPPSGWTGGLSSSTAVGTNERTLRSGYFETSSTASTTPSFSLASSASWATILTKFLVDTTAPAGTLVKVWNGSSWVDKTAAVKVWNGTSWVVKTVKAWDGTSWV